MAQALAGLTPDDRERLTAALPPLRGLLKRLQEMPTEP
jgi:uncharacterized protein with von Willebrand factor type A (vWA) domain